jgi:hypothetical protein
MPGSASSSYRHHELIPVRGSTLASITLGGVGEAVGVMVGGAVGTVVGVGVAVGTGVGVAVGTGVGVRVGSGVGVAVGFGVGFAVGLGVGVGHVPQMLFGAAVGAVPVDANECRLRDPTRP